jgi:multicomponent Na+:H+ antiporter subunit F
MSDEITLGLEIALTVMVLLLLPVVYRAVTGPAQAERLQSIDTMSGLLVGIIVLLALVQRSGLLMDVALALAAFSFIATLGISRYLSQGRVF